MRGTVRAVAGLVLAAAVAAGCSSSGDEAGGRPAAGKKTPSGPALPETVDTVGPITDPLMQAIWLVRAPGTAEADDYDTRSQGLFVDGDVAVYYALDTIIGASLEDGSTVWKTPVDMGGGVVEQAGTAPHDDHRWSFVYADSSNEDLDQWGEHLVTVDTQTGAVIANDVLDTFGTVDAMVSAGGRDYLATDKGLSTVGSGGELRRLVKIKDLGGKRDVVRDMSPIAGTDVIVLAMTDNTSLISSVVGVDAKQGRVLWRHSPADLGVEPGDYHFDLSPGDGRYLVTQEFRDNPRTGSDEFLHLWVLDPETGEVVHRSRTEQRTPAKKPHYIGISHEEIGPGNPRGMFAVDDDIVFEDANGVSRYDPVRERFVWTTRTGLMGMRNGQHDYPSWDLGPLSADGTLVFAMLSAGPSGDLLALDLETGEIKGRWAFDDRTDAGLLSRPLLALSGDRMVLGRNRDFEGDPDSPFGKSERLGKINDLGMVQFPAAG